MMTSLVSTILLFHILFSIYTTNNNNNNMKSYQSKRNEIKDIQK